MWVENYRIIVWELLKESLIMSVTEAFTEIIKTHLRTRERIIVSQIKIKTKDLLNILQHLKNHVL